MNKIIRAPNLKSKKNRFLLYSAASLRNNQIMHSGPINCNTYAFAALTIDKTFTRHNFSFKINEFMSIYSPIEFKNK